MKKTTIYRADDYMDNSGDFLGFFKNLEYTKGELEFSKEVKIADGTFSQIIKFTVLTSEFEKGNFDDKEFMMDLWGEGEIVKNYYFVK